MPFAIVFLATTSTLTAEDRTEVRSRIAASEVTFDAETDPSLKYRLVGRHGDDDLSVFYTPRLILTRFADDARDVEALNSGGYQFQAHRGRTNLAILELGTYGTVSANSLFIQPRWSGEGPPPTVLPIPVDPTLRFTLLSSQSAIAVSHTISRRLVLTLSGNYGAYGGPDNESRKRLPLTQGPGTDVKLQYSASRQDDVSVSGGANYTSVSVADGVTTPSPAERAYGELRWHHGWSTLASTDLAGGAVVAHQAGLIGGSNSSGATVYPSAELLTQIAFRQREARAALVFVARVQPWIDPFTGTLEQRAEGALAGSWTIGLDTLRAQGVVQQVIPTAESAGRYALVYGELSFEHRLSRTFSLDIGVRVAAEKVNTGAAAADATTEQGVGFVGATWRPLPAKL